MGNDSNLKLLTVEQVPPQMFFAVKPSTASQLLDRGYYQTDSHPIIYTDNPVDCLKSTNLEDGPVCVIRMESFDAALMGSKFYYDSDQRRIIVYHIPEEYLTVILWVTSE